VIPGAITGSVPVMMGWIAGGGSLSSAGLFLASFNFHLADAAFWLIMMKIQRRI